MSAERQLAAKYALAALQLARAEASAEAVLGDLRQAKAVFGRNEGLRLLAHPLLDSGKKLAVVRELLGDSLSAIAFALIRLLVEKRRGALLAAVAEAYEEEWRRGQGKQSARVVTALPFTREQLDGIAKRLEALTHRGVELEQTVEPRLGAGARVTVGDWVFDGTLEKRVAQLRQALQNEN